MRRLVLAFLAPLLVGNALAEPLSKKEFKGLKRKAVRAAAAGQGDVLAGHITDLAQDDSSRAVDLIGNLILQASEGGAYEAARDGLAAMGSAASERQAKLLTGKRTDPRLKVLLVDSLGLRTDRASGEAIGAALKARDERVVRAALDTIGEHKLVWAVDGLIDLYGVLSAGARKDSALMLRTRKALLAVTGKQMQTVEDWRKFWEPRKASFRPQTGAPAKLDKTSERPPPTFFGTEIRSDRLVFVIDTSGSMEKEDPGGEGERGPNSRVRMDRAKRQLIKVIKALHEQTQFTILAYEGVLSENKDTKVVTLPRGVSKTGDLPDSISGRRWLRTWSPKLMRASAGNKKKAISYVEALKAKGWTFTLEALKRAFAVEGADTIVLLSDGLPREVNREADREFTLDEVTAAVSALNRFARRRIDTFGFLGKSSSLGRFMRDLAEQNGGKHTRID